MTRRNAVQAALLIVVVFTTLPPLARLAKGRTPSLLVSANLPFWERRSPRPLPLKGVRLITPSPPGSVEPIDPNTHALFWNADEDILIRPLEHPDADPHDDTTRAGRWLEAACSLGRTDRTMRGKQDRVASRLIGTQLSNGWFGKDPGGKKRTDADWDAQTFSLRGLLAFYSITRSPAAIYAAEASGTGVMRVPLGFVHTHRLLLPLALLYRQTGDTELLTWCRQAVRAGRGDAAGECALYEATGERAWLLRAARAWPHPVPMQRSADTTSHHFVAVKRDWDGAAALWMDTGDTRYLPSLRMGSGLALCPLTPGSLAYGRIPRGIRVTLWTASRATFGRVGLSQTLSRTTSGSHRVMLTVHVPKPTAFLLNVPPCASSALLNGKPVVFHGTLLRRWKNNDTLIVTAK